ncbi:DUF2971 domain-containing protein [Photobacterium iliopiscarium]|uniref:DUF2971 domain-containing protein n=1 Tax=Photobacterium iliopiscarium TaxID=56192 RepID=UPI0005D3D400|nr:DUF2971 domain-containing protein [Photobacterium iliopiscarium]KJG13571.1 hypothetical protein UB38_09140 [Photobacterium iliopiscarium]PST99587.1 DUF2971 domain-containing protein [Photobacterium iliopiscarium]PSV82911.1 DUF2971 domain-containing protein [Photobacterium iliopiscarium]
MKFPYNKTDSEMEFLSSKDALFHFTKKDTAIENILNDRTLRFGTLSGTNDPQEYKQKLTGAIGWGWEDRHNDKVSEVTNLIDEFLRKETKFISFCQSSFVDNKLSTHGLLKSRMWSQYGDNHRGICIVISKSKFLKQLKDQYRRTHVLKSSNVAYEEPSLESNIPCLDVDAPVLDESKSGDIALSFIKEFSQSLLFTKQPDYKDENEFRVVAINIEKIDDSEFIYIDLNTCIHSIILGDAFPYVYKPTIQKLAKELNVPCKKLHWEHHAYVLLNWSKES